MKCEKIDEYINLYLDGLISEEQTNELNQHIKACEKCREAFLVIKKAKEIIDGEEEAELPENFHKELTEKISKLEKDKKIIKFPFYKITAVAAAFAITVFACYNFNADDFHKGVDVSGLETQNIIIAEKDDIKENAVEKEEKPQTVTEEKNEIKINTKEVVKTAQPEAKKEMPVADYVQNKTPQTEEIKIEESVQPVTVSEESQAEPQMVAEIAEASEPVYDEAATFHKARSFSGEAYSETDEKTACEILSELGFGEITGEKTFKFDLSVMDEVKNALSEFKDDSYSITIDNENQIFIVTCY